MTWIRFLKEYYMENYHYLCFYRRLISKHSIFFDTPNYYRSRTIRVQRITKRFLFTLFIASYYNFFFGSSCIWPELVEENVYWIVVEFLPKSQQFHFTLTVLTWCNANLLVLLALPNFLSEFCFLSVFDLYRKDSIKLLGLNQEKLSELKHFKRTIFEPYSPITNFVTDVTALIAILVIIYTKQLWSKNWLVCLIHLILTSAWIHLNTSTNFGLAPYLWQTSFYLKLKQEIVIEKMISLEKRLRKNLPRTTFNPNRIGKEFIEFCLKNSRINAEIFAYNREFRFLYTILFVDHIQNTTYITYLLFFAEFTSIFFLYVIFYILIFFILLSTIYHASLLITYNKQISELTYRICYLITKSERLESIRLKRFQTIAINRVPNNLIGFRLVNDFLVNNLAYYEVYYMVSVFFFLILRKKK
ncbi:hypothetical protein SSS_01087 [Sarcoptes scabiei]|uniref:Uncharacterized protein n=1 Tax=Sarcoptes scabiei TaxID=52283 RepID=A0A834VEX7_SARSC|nr:hypothetical protein SSS_01087 [Sarcoptes scabiei]